MPLTDTDRQQIERIKHRKDRDIEWLLEVIDRLTADSAPLPKYHFLTPEEHYHISFMRNVVNVYEHGTHAFFVKDIGDLNQIVTKMDAEIDRLRSELGRFEQDYWLSRQG